MRKSWRAVYRCASAFRGSGNEIERMKEAKSYELNHNGDLNYDGRFGVNKSAAAVTEARYN